MASVMSSWGKPLNAGKRAALIVEDDPQVQKAMSRQLALLDFCVLTACHYDAAVRHLAECELQVVCIDVELPTRSGYELCEHIRGSLELAELPILMTSDYGSPQDRAYAEDAGGNAFLHKPFSMGQFTRCIESLSGASGWSVPPALELQTMAWMLTPARRLPNRRVENAARPHPPPLSASGATNRSARVFVQTMRHQQNA
ncbi:MAG TPA: response regulator [Polyangiaceae bacterium]|nr:response regulator [Polyangiaceae bacterium]